MGIQGPTNYDSFNQDILGVSSNNPIQSDPQQNSQLTSEIDKLRDKISQLQDEVNQLQVDHTLTPEQKSEKIKELNEKFHTLMKDIENEIGKENPLTEQTTDLLEVYQALTSLSLSLLPRPFTR